MAEAVAEPTSVSRKDVLKEMSFIVQFITL